MRVPCLAVAVLTVAACGEVAAPAADERAVLAPRFDEMTVPRDQSFDATPIACDQKDDRACTIVVGQTKLVGWYITGGAAAVSGIRSPAQLSMVVGPFTDTIPGPPTIGGLRAALGSSGISALNAFVAAAGLNPLTDTIPGPPTRFIFAQRNAHGQYAGDALMLFSVNELVAKKVLVPSGDARALSVVWRGPSGASYVAAGILPPTDTIPGPPTADVKK